MVDDLLEALGSATVGSVISGDKEATPEATASKESESEVVPQENSGDSTDPMFADPLTRCYVCARPNRVTYRQKSGISLCAPCLRGLDKDRP